MLRRESSTALQLLMSVAVSNRFVVTVERPGNFVSDCRSRGRELDPGPVTYFNGD